MIQVLVHSTDLSLQYSLTAAGGADFSVLTERRIDNVREIALQGHSDVLIVDLDAVSNPLRERQLSLLEEVRNPGIAVVAVTCDEGKATAMELVQRGVCNYVRKPIPGLELGMAVRRAHEVAALKRELEHACRPVQTAVGVPMVGSSPQLQGVYDLIRRVAGSDVPVLIGGESGTGKELIARSIHNTGDRRGHPFVAVACGAIPETLIEAELFGAERGAFTGAAARRRGYLEEAGDGTVFFDEIGELSAHTQVRLLRVLQEREFSRLGSSQAIRLQARLLFATHRNLAAMVEAGTFRQDLYYRVNVVSITAPPLRDRAEDLPQLALHFLGEYSRMYKKSVAGISPNAMAQLLEYDWPGNIRELENAIQSAIIMCDDGTIKPMDLPQSVRGAGLAPETSLAPGDSFEERLQDFKVRLAQKAIQECNGNKTLAARSLQISRTYLHRLIRDPLEGAGLLSSAAPN